MTQATSSFGTKGRWTLHMGDGTVYPIEVSEITLTPEPVPEPVPSTESRSIEMSVSWGVTPVMRKSLVALAVAALLGDLDYTASSAVVFKTLRRKGC